jgi:Sensors of blue-light using FAD
MRIAMVFTLIYVSDSNISPVGDLVLAEMLDIEIKANVNNTLYDVRGFLFYFQNQFLQILQGEFDCIIAMYAKIKDDSRHRNLRILWFSDDAAFAFSPFSMSYSIGYAIEHYQELTLQPSLIRRFVPERGHLSPEAHRVLMAMATQTGDAFSANQDKLYG